MKTRTNLKAWLTISVFLIGVGLVAQGVVVGDTFTVTNTNDSGPDSLREAIKLANANPGRDLIAFDITGPGPHTIQPVSPLPELNEEVVIDGYTQPGSHPATGASNAVLNIVLDGSSSSGHLGLLSIDPTASACEIRGLVISNYDRNGIFIESGANGNVIEGNYIGTDYTGNAEQPNLNCGIFIKSSNNRIGGTTPDARNVISCNAHQGIEIWGSAASGNQVLGNFIGTDASGTSYLPNNGNGVSIIGAPYNLVGGTALGSRNVITNVTITSLGATNNQVIGNYIGINASGDVPLNLHYGQGVIIDQTSHNVIGPDNVISGHARGLSIWAGSSYNSVRGNYIGTDATGQSPIGFEWDGVTVNGSYNTIEDNVICASGAHGIYVNKASSGEIPSHNILSDNIIGMNASKDTALPNKNGILINTAVDTTISRNLIAGNRYNGVVVVNNLSVGNHITQNSIYDNGVELGGLGIDLALDGVIDGVTPNDPGDTDIGPNNLMNYPVLDSALNTPGRLVVRGTIDTPNLMNVTLEFFANSAPDATGYGEGEIYLGEAKPNASGVFTAVLPAESPGMWISATATDIHGNTSEFALSIEATSPGKGKK